MAKGDLSKKATRKKPGRAKGKSPGKTSRAARGPAAAQHESKQPMEKKMAQKNTASFEKLTQDGVDAGRQYSEACMKSGALLMKGFEDLMSAVVSLAQESGEKQARLMKEAMSSKTLNEWADAQNKIAQTGFDDFMNGATKITELSVKILNESADPVNQQMTSAVKKASEAMAA